MEEEQITEEIVQEEVEQVAEEVVQEAVEEAPAPDFNMDFNDIGSPEPEPVAQEPDYDQVIENIVGKVLEKQKIKPESEKSEDDDDDMTYLSKKDLAEYENKIVDRVRREQQQQQQAHDTIQQTVQGAEVVRQQYEQKFIRKLAEHGIDLKDNPHMVNQAALLFDNLKMTEAAKRGRLMMDPKTQQAVAILSPQEMKTLVQTHWNQFTQTYLPAARNAPVKTVTPSLSPAANGRQVKAGIDNSDAYTQFMEKKARGEETLGDALNLLLNSSGKK